MSKFARYQATRSPAMATKAWAVNAQVRPIEIHDCEALGVILTRREGGGSVAARREWFKTQVDRSDSLLLVAEVSGKVVGYGRVVHHEGSEGCPTGWYLAGLVVSSRFRRLGIGRLLTTRRVEWIVERASEVFYFANEKNQATIDLHAALGFTEFTREFTFPGVGFQGGTRNTVPCGPPYCRLAIEASISG